MATDFIPWAAIADAYRSDATVVAAVEEFIRTTSVSETQRGLYLCSLVARTDWVRDHLLSQLTPEHFWGIGWTIRALIEGWPHDEAVKAALTALVGSDSTDVPAGAISFLAEIITEPAEAMERLTQISAATTAQYAVIDALRSLLGKGTDRADPRVQSIVARVLASDMTSFWNSPESGLYLGFPDDPKVRELASSHLADRDAPLDDQFQGVPAETRTRASMIVL
jgi:hypothetical protein